MWPSRGLLLTWRSERHSQLHQHDRIPSSSIALRLSSKKRWNRKPGSRSVNQLPKPLSPSNRSRVHKLSPTYRSHDVQYEAGPHTSPADQMRTRYGPGSGDLIPRQAKSPARRVSCGTPGGTRTPNLLIRSQTLCPIELRAQELSIATGVLAIRPLGPSSIALIEPSSSTARCSGKGGRGQRSNPHAQRSAAYPCRQKVSYSSTPNAAR
jgi:hypothetical protein